MANRSLDKNNNSSTRQYHQHPHIDITQGRSYFCVGLLQGFEALIEVPASRHEINHIPIPLANNVGILFAEVLDGSLISLHRRNVLLLKLGQLVNLQTQHVAFHVKIVRLLLIQISAPNNFIQVVPEMGNILLKPAGVGDGLQ